MYSPSPDGFSARGSDVRYTESKPGGDLAEVVHCFWELRTLAKLREDFQYLALPDACVNLLFNLIDTDIAGVTALHTAATTLNLGTDFHYVGVQFYPGVWQGDRNEIVNQYVGTAYQGALPLIKTNRQLVGLEFEAMSVVLTELVHWCVARGQVCSNHITAKILSNLNQIRSVAE